MQHWQINPYFVNSNPKNPVSISDGCNLDIVCIVQVIGSIQKLCVEDANLHREMWLYAGNYRFYMQTRPVPGYAVTQPSHGIFWHRIRLRAQFNLVQPNIKKKKVLPVTSSFEKASTQIP